MSPAVLDRTHGQLHDLTSIGRRGDVQSRVASVDAVSNRCEVECVRFRPSGALLEVRTCERRRPNEQARCGRRVARGHRPRKRHER